MASLELSRQIGAPPQKVFEVFTDLTRAAERVRGIQSLEILTPGPVGRGTRFRETRVMFGRKATEEMEVTDYQPPRSFAFGGESCGARITTRFDLRPQGSGTQLDVHMETEALSFFAKLMSPLAGLMMGPMRKAFEADLDDLQSVAEQRAS